ncbi:GlxA family transcriptional regulator [Arhodomonas sp. AD133]|uniref:GlxA family transcriptional regulator n=1 Tax=Arhodomonas sp. AD133 TaxID=3415009 RepID=UPI003EBC2457
MRAATSAHRIGALLLPQFSFVELGLVIEPLFILNWLAQRPLFEWQLLSVDGRPVIASSGVPVPVEATLPAPETLDSVFVFASFETKTYADDRRAKVWLRRAAAAGLELAGIETGTEVLAAAGLMTGHGAAVHWDNRDGFQELYPDVHVTPGLYTVEPRRLSCAGGTAVLDMMLHWLEAHIDEHVLAELRHHLLARPPRQGNTPQLTDGHGAEEVANPLVRRALRLMREYIETPLSAGALAERLGVSVRQLERHFKAELDVPPIRYYIWLRVNRAHRLLQQTDLSVAEVAASAGFNSLEHFSRVYRHYFGCAPSADRLQTTEAPVIPVRAQPSSDAG